MNNLIYNIGYWAIWLIAAIVATGVVSVLVIAWTAIMEDAYQQVRNTYYLIVFKRVCRLSRTRKERRQSTIK